MSILYNQDDTSKQSGLIQLTTLHLFIYSNTYWTSTESEAQKNAWRTSQIHIPGLRCKEQSDPWSRLVIAFTPSFEFEQKINKRTHILTYIYQLTKYFSFSFHRRKRNMLYQFFGGKCINFRSEIFLTLTTNGEIKSWGTGELSPQINATSSFGPTSISTR